MPPAKIMNKVAKINIQTINFPHKRRKNIKQKLQNISPNLYLMIIASKIDPKITILAVLMS
jgi:hypothetical protein